MGCSGGKKETWWMMIHCCCFTHPHKPVNKWFFLRPVYILSYYCNQLSVSLFNYYHLQGRKLDSPLQLTQQAKGIMPERKEKPLLRSVWSVLFLYGGGRWFGGGHSGSNDSLRAKSERPTTEEKVKTSIMWSGWSGLLTVYSSHSLKPNIYLYNAKVYESDQRQQVASFKKKRKKKSISLEANNSTNYYSQHNTVTCSY